MALLEPEASGGVAGDGDEADNDPVLRAMLNAPIGEPLTDEERKMIEELGDEPHGVDHETMMSLLAARDE